MLKTTAEERKAIRALEKLAKTWPKSLMLFSWSGSLCVVKTKSDGTMPIESNREMNERVVGVIRGIGNDGGDP